MEIKDFSERDVEQALQDVKQEIKNGEITQLLFCYPLNIGILSNVERILNQEYDLEIQDYKTGEVHPAKVTLSQTFTNPTTFLIEAIDNEEIVGGIHIDTYEDKWCRDVIIEKLDKGDYDEFLRDAILLKLSFEGSYIDMSADEKERLVLQIIDDFGAFLKTDRGTWDAVTLKVVQGVLEKLRE